MVSVHRSLAPLHYEGANCGCCIAPSVQNVSSRPLRSTEDLALKSLRASEAVLYRVSRAATTLEPICFLFTDR